MVQGRGLLPIRAFFIDSLQRYYIVVPPVLSSLEDVTSLKVNLPSDGCLVEPTKEVLASLFHGNDGETLAEMEEPSRAKEVSLEILFLVPPLMHLSQGWY